MGKDVTMSQHLPHIILCIHQYRVHILYKVPWYSLQIGYHNTTIREQRHRSYTHRYVMFIRFMLCSCLSASQVVGVYCLSYLHSLAWLHSLLATCGFQLYNISIILPLEYCEDILEICVCVIYPICNILRKCYRNIQV